MRHDACADVPFDASRCSPKRARGTPPRIVIDVLVPSQSERIDAQSGLRRQGDRNAPEGSEHRQRPHPATVIITHGGVDAIREIANCGRRYLPSYTQ